MSTSKELFPGARVSTHRIARSGHGAQKGTVLKREMMHMDDGTTYLSCKCGCGGYSSVLWDGYPTPMSFMAHDMILLDIIEQLGARAEVAE